MLLPLCGPTPFSFCEDKYTTVSWREYCRLLVVPLNPSPLPRVGVFGASSANVVVATSASSQMKLCGDVLSRGLHGARLRGRLTSTPCGCNVTSSSFYTRDGFNQQRALQTRKNV